ncbi:hypothetical protein DUGA2_57070 [Duganella sp. HH101]|nr:hypothetical protein DUGA2_56200 [Duganella sp. HH101]OEZ98402.1 hypothetical protein DUGA2_57070 [Duganella sp. HH101]
MPPLPTLMLPLVASAEMLPLGESTVKWPPSTMSLIAARLMVLFACRFEFPINMMSVLADSVMSFPVMVSVIVTGLCAAIDTPPPLPATIAPSVRMPPWLSMTMLPL